jgi:hypothetical protein
MDCHLSETQQSLETLLGMQEQEEGKMRCRGKGENNG